MPYFSRMKRSLRYFEFILLYAVLPLCVSILPPAFSRFGIRIKIGVISILITFGGCALVYLLTSSGFDKKIFLRGFDICFFWHTIFPRFMFAALLLIFLLLKLDKTLLFSFPTQNPKLWLLVVFCYPILSVIPQTILYRVLYEYRYAELFSSKVSLFAGAAAFSFAHIVFVNMYALVFTFLGGLLFLSTYRKTQSFAASAIEHAMYGNLIFTIGWGQFFYSGTIRFLET